LKKLENENIVKHFGQKRVLKCVKDEKKKIQYLKNIRDENGFHSANGGVKSANHSNSYYGGNFVQSGYCIQGNGRCI
jgi:hypothetical protein